jgi:uncharacterized protein YegP (UPF0339 family)
MAARRPVIEKIQDVAGEWRWRLRAANGQIIATGGEGYDSKFNVERAIDTVVHAFTQCEIEADEEA